MEGPFWHLYAYPNTWSIFVPAILGHFRNPLVFHKRFQAIKFYDAIAERAAKNGHAIDVWGCALDQVGLHEMKNLIVGTGGYVIQADSFASSLFVQSFKRIWEKDEKEQIDMNFNATVEIKTSREVKVCGMIGAGTSLKANSSSVSENEMGVGRVPNKLHAV